jgi:CspA family cold shock protein
LTGPVGTAHPGGHAHPLGTASPAHRGNIESFDKDVGLGQVRSQDGTIYPFHCTEIADGSRDIAAGTEVNFAVAPGHLGSWEARQLEPVA